MSPRTSRPFGNISENFRGDMNLAGECGVGNPNKLIVKRHISVLSSSIRTTNLCKNDPKNIFENFPKSHHCGLDSSRADLIKQLAYHKWAGHPCDGSLWCVCHIGAVSHEDELTDGVALIFLAFSLPNLPLSIRLRIRS